MCLNLLLCILLLLPLQSRAAGPPLPEDLRYELSWLGITVGRSALQTAAAGEGIEIVSTVASAAWTAPFYRVDDREVSTLRRGAAGFEQGSYLKELREGELRVDRRIDYDRTNRRITQRNLAAGTRVAFDFAGEAWDPVAATFILRRRLLRVGESIQLNLLDNDRPNPVTVRVLRRESITVPAGTFPALVLQSEPVFDSEGLFYAPGTLTVWLSDDDARRPLRIDKRVNGLFAQGIPIWLRPLVPDAMLDSPKLETVRAELVE